MGWWQNLLGKVGSEAIKESEAIKPEVKTIPLAENQYYKKALPKKHIFLHHTAGGSAASSIAHWAANPEHIATPYVIDRDGTIYECFDPQYWAYSLGVKGNSTIERETIAIEICSYGQLIPNTKGDFVAYTGKIIPKEKVVAVDWRGYKYWEAYTPEQIEALSKLLPYLIKKFNIPLQPNRERFWEYHVPAMLPPGIWSHTTVRKDKFDIFPQKELVELIKSL